MPRILLVEDEPNLALTVSDLLSAKGHAVETAGDGEAGVRAGKRSAFDLVIVDVMLPLKDGFEVCRELRAHRNDIAILMLTARTQVADRVLGLRLGADDYLAKPFDPEELLARVDALLRRAGKDSRVPAGTVRFSDIEVDFDRATLRKSGERLNVAGKELQLLLYLVQHSGRVITRHEILQNVWDYKGDVSSRTLDVHVAWLRQKLERDPQHPEHIHTVRGRGYRFSM
jgi:two-component system alkaline phosphatase synthesis response regulator PhoP